jgi:hypothetical protein
LDRIILLERTKLLGCNDPIWPRFGERELRADLSFNPLQAFDDQNLS